MNDKIKNHVTSYCQKKGWTTSEADLIETIREAKEVWTGNDDEHRHWIEYDAVVEIDGMFIQFISAKGAGDMGVYDAGWEFNESSIIEVEPKEIKIVTYVPVKEKQNGL